MPNNNFPVDYKDIPSCEPCKKGRFDENEIATNKLNILSQLFFNVTWQTVPNSKIWIFWLDLLYFDIFFCGDALCGYDKLLTNNFQGKMWIIFGIFIGKSKFLMCYGVTIEISLDPRIVEKW